MGSEVNHLEVENVELALIRIGLGRRCNAAYRDRKPHFLDKFFHNAASPMTTGLQSG
jgi:hypothetical protein